MVHKCFVFNCPIGRKSCKEKASVFKCPKDERMLQKWRQNVPQQYRILTSADHICAKHFESRYVIPRYQQIKGDFYQDFIRPRLSPNAVPTIFPNTEKGIRPAAVNDVKPAIVPKQPCTPRAIAPKKPESLVSLMARELSNGIEVNDMDCVPVCFNCLVGKCSSHTLN